VVLCRVFAEQRNHLTVVVGLRPRNSPIIGLEKAVSRLGYYDTRYKRVRVSFRQMTGALRTQKTAAVCQAIPSFSEGSVFYMIF
jgi:hypothetical protein